MSEKEKEIGKTIAEAFNALPDNKKEYLIGYAEGVLARSEKQEVRVEHDEQSAGREAG